jgi:hypothetical protein
MGEGGVVATTIRNDLCMKAPRLREKVEQLEDAETGS